jgi:uncharacterized membrane protein
MKKYAHTRWLSNTLSNNPSIYNSNNLLDNLNQKIKLTEQQVPMMGLLTALFFAAMMMNYPIAGGTTAHLLGGASIGLILGPFAGCISITVILVLQAFLFGDGGLTTLGANVLNMGIIGVFIPCAIFPVMNKVLKIKSNQMQHYTPPYSSQHSSVTYSQQSLPAQNSDYPKTSFSTV